MPLHAARNVSWAMSSLAATSRTIASEIAVTVLAHSAATRPNASSLPRIAASTSVVSVFMQLSNTGAKFVTEIVCRARLRRAAARRSRALRGRRLRPENRSGHRLSRHRLDQVVIDAELELRLVLIALALVDGGDDDDARPVLGRHAAHEAGDLETVHFGQEPIEQQDLGAMLLDKLDRLETRGRLDCFAAQ